MITNEFIAHEGNVGSDAFELWCNRVERLAANVLHLDHKGKPTLDGSETVEGHSIDGAYADYCAGVSADDFARELIERLAEPGPDTAMEEGCRFERMFDGNDLGG